MQVVERVWKFIHGFSSAHIYTLDIAKQYVIITMLTHVDKNGWLQRINIYLMFEADKKKKKRSICDTRGSCNV